VYFKKWILTYNFLLLCGILSSQAVIKVVANETCFPLKKWDITLDYTMAFMLDEGARFVLTTSKSLRYYEVLHTQVSKDSTSIKMP
jgi:hypothetical protein